MTETRLEDLVEFFILGDEPCVGFYESKIKKTGISIYEFQKQLVSALKLQELVKKEIKMWEDDKDFGKDYLMAYCEEYVNLINLVKKSTNTLKLESDE